jgi:hypothetical protein
LSAWRFNLIIVIACSVASSQERQSGLSRGEAQSACLAVGQVLLGATTGTYVSDVTDGKIRGNLYVPGCLNALHLHFHLIAHLLLRLQTSTCLLILWHRVFLEKSIVTRLTKKFSSLQKVKDHYSVHRISPLDHT